MNNKGFTLVEMLAVIIILVVIGGIATVGVINTINNTKLQSEKIFVNKLSNLIDDYLDLYRPTKEIGETYTTEKCFNSDCSKKYSVDVIEVMKNEGKIYLKDLVDNNIIQEEKLVNPKNNKKCLEGNGPEIKVYRDEDYVYYYYVDLTINTSCDISVENGTINTLPDDLKSEVGVLS